MRPPAAHRRLGLWRCLVWLLISCSVIATAPVSPADGGGNRDLVRGAVKASATVTGHQRAPGVDILYIWRRHCLHDGRDRGPAPGPAAPGRPGRAGGRGTGGPHPAGHRPAGRVSHGRRCATSPPWRRCWRRWRPRGSSGWSPPWTATWPRPRAAAVGAGGGSARRPAAARRRRFGLRPLCPRRSGVFSVTFRPERVDVTDPGVPGRRVPLVPAARRPGRGRPGGRLAARRPDPGPRRGPVGERPRPGDARAPRRAGGGRRDRVPSTGSAPCPPSLSSDPKETPDDHHHLVPRRQLRPRDRGGHDRRAARVRPPTGGADRPARAHRPQPQGGARPAAYHWFTGDGMVHGVRLEGGGPPGTATAGWAAARSSTPT